MTHHCTQQSSDPRRMFNLGKWAGTAFLVATLFIPAAASAAAWESRTIATHPTWIYTPDGKLQGSAKRGLMVVLHGCVQTNDQVKNGGNLEGVAEQFGLVVAVPYVTKADGYIADCWNYDGGTGDQHGHLAEIIALTRDLTKDGAIDPKHVYVVGLSSGGALALKLGCKAPDLYAGIGAIAGPSVGSSQYSATVDKSGIPSTNVDNAIKVCKALAGGNAASLGSQIANIAYGDMDRNGPKQIIETPQCQQVHPGQNCVASSKWSEDNVKILQGIYGAGPLGPQIAVQDGKATEQNAKAKADDKIALGLLVMHNVGHAFAAGSGQPNNTVNGQYIAQQGPNHFKYVAQWLTEHNRRGATGPVVTCDDPKVAGYAVTLDCSASGPRPITSYHVVISGPTARDETLPREGSLSKKYDGLAAGSYQAVVSATDDKGVESPKITSRQFQIPAAAAPSCISADNKTHVAKSRAHACYVWWYCANGSEDYLGYFSSTITSLQLKPDKPDYWTKVGSCTVQ